LRFWKLSALGNCFLVVPVTRNPKRSVLAGVRSACDPVTGVGADGVAFVNTRTRYLHIYNADGGRAEISGNGARCAAAWWFGSRRGARQRVTWRSDAGPIECVRTGKQVVAVTMPPPSFAPQDIPAKASTDTLLDYRLKLGAGGKRGVRISALSVGNPQAVIWGEHIPKAWREIGAAIETHRFFPERCNVVFARKRVNGIEARIWERGVGESPASGTGAAAAAVEGARRGETGRHTRVMMPGGTMRVHWLKSGEIRTTCAVGLIASGEFKRSLM